MLQDAFNTLFTVNLVGGVYIVVCLNCYEADVASLLVGHLDAELVFDSAKEKNLTRPRVFQRGYGIISVVFTLKVYIISYIVTVDGKEYAHVSLH